MEGLILDYQYQPGDVFHLTPYSDLHDDARACALADVRAHMAKRAALPNPIFCGLGDIGNWVFDGNDRRRQPSTPRPEFADQDEYIDRVIEEQAFRYKGLPWAFIGMGNHETAVNNHHHTNVTKRLCTLLGVPYAGYSSLVRFRFIGSSGKIDCTSTMLWHHGAWGGKVQKGFGGARDYARGFDDWDFFCYGHNHQLNVHHETRVSMSIRGHLEDRDVFFVNTGTFQRGMTQGGSPAYSEIKGYGPVALSCPLIKIQPRGSGGVKVSVEVGDC